MVAQARHTGIFGATRLSDGLLSWSLPSSFTERWQRWIASGRTLFDGQADLDRRAWRFVAAAGVFDSVVSAGVWRQSEDRAGRRYPLLIATVGAAPAPGDAWFDRSDEIISAAIEDLLSDQSIARRVAALPEFAAAPAPDMAAHFWLDDWQVHELCYDTIEDFVKFGLNDMFAPRPETEDA